VSFYFAVMAPQVTVYFHQLPSVRIAGEQKKVGFKTTFAITGAPVAAIVPKVFEVSKAKQSSKALCGKAAKGLKKRQARSAKRKFKQAVKTVAVLLPKIVKNVKAKTVKTVKTCLAETVKIKDQQPVQIMVGSIPINIGIVESVMMTSAEEISTPTSPITKEVDSFTTSPNVSKTLEKSIQKGKVKAIVSDRNQTGLVTQLGENSVKLEVVD